jgi:hypothetical protein
MYMNHKHEIYMFICEIYKVYNFNFHWHSKCDKIECTDLKISDRMHWSKNQWSNAVVIVLCRIFRGCGHSFHLECNLPDISACPICKYPLKSKAESLGQRGSHKRRFFYFALVLYGHCWQNYSRVETNCQKIELQNCSENAFFLKCRKPLLKGNGNINFYFLIWKNFWNYLITSCTDSSYLAYFLKYFHLK